MTRTLLHTSKWLRGMILLLGIAVTSAAVPVPELTVRPAVPTLASPIEQQVAQLQQQVQVLQTQLAALQAIVQITTASVAGQEPSVTIAAGNLQLRAAGNLMLQSGASTAIRSSTSVDVRSSANTTIRAAGPLNMDGSSVRFNGGTKMLATVGSIVQTNVPLGTTGTMIPVSGQVVNGSQTVFAN